MAEGINRRLPPIEINDRLISRFWHKVDKRGPDECWPWLACERNGYGAIKIGPVYSSHRVAYVLTYGEPPDDLLIGHKCDNRICCNPKHLEAITPGQNVRDAKERIRHFMPIGEEVHTAVLTSESVHTICKMRVETKMSAAKISKSLGLSIHATKCVLEKHSWRHITSQYEI